MTTSAEVARHLAGYGLRLTPGWPLDAAGWCTCPDPACNGKKDPHAAGKHPRWRKGNATSSQDWWQANPADTVLFERDASHVMTLEDDGQLEQMAQARGLLPLPPTLTLESPAGNLRMVYRLPEGFTAKGDYPHLDGWAVDIACFSWAPGPGVRSNGGQYAVMLDRPPEQAPAALVALLEELHAARHAARTAMAAVNGTEPAHIPDSVAQLTGHGPAGGWKLSEDGSIDRSRMANAVVRECFDTGLALAEATWIAESMSEIAGKYGGRPGGVAAQVAEIWSKAEAGPGSPGG